MRKIDVCKPTIHIENMSTIQEDCKRWAEEIKKSYHPDLIIFIAKSGFLFAKPMAEIFGCNMADIVVERPGNNSKNRLQKIIDVLPMSVIAGVLRSPFMYKFNAAKKERQIRLTPKYEAECRKKYEKILIVDDSVDTGWNLLKVLELTKKNFLDAKIKVASYSVIEYSKVRVQVDFIRFENRIVITATSRKSEEYQTFLEMYGQWKEK